MRVLRSLFLLIVFTIILGISAYAQVLVNPGATSYSTLASACTAINAGTHTGAVTVEISANTTETATCVINSSGAGSANYTSINIYPTVDGVTINGSTTAASGRGVIELNGADNVTIDGDNPNSAGINRNLTIINNNSSTTTYTSVVRIALSTLISSGNNNTVKNAILTGSATGRNISTATSTSGSEHTTYGILVGGGASTVLATTSPSAITSVSTTIGSGITATNFTATNNQIDACARGIAVQGSATTVAAGLTVTNNTIGNATAGNTTTVYSRGMTLQGFDAATISGNTVRNIESFIATSTMGIGLGEVSSSGINAVIERNTVTNVFNKNTTTFGAYGINLIAGNNNTIRNNFVSQINHDMTGGAAFSTSFGVFGIRVAAGTGNKVQNNSVNLFGAHTGTATTSLLSAALIITGTGLTGMDVRNNILANTLTGGTTSIAHVALYLPSGGTSTMALNLNNNDYYFGTDTARQGAGQAGTTAGTGFFTTFNAGATTPATNLRSYTNTLNTTANDDLSVSVDPLFVSTTDLHLLASSTLLNIGATIATVTNDIDGDTRPIDGLYEIGADERAAVVAPGEFKFSSATYAGNEGTTATITVQRVNGSAGAVSVNYATSDGTANAGTCGTEDYVASSGTLNWASGDFSSKTFSVTLCSDAVLDTSETVNLALSSPTGGATLTTPNTAVLTIGDVPPPFNGTYTVGSGGNYSSLTNAGGLFAALNVAGASGPVTINITSDLTGETGANALNAITGSPAVTIKPSSSPRSITGSATGCLITINGADNVTIDGAVSGTTRDMTITNTNAGISSAVVCLQNTAAPDGATNNIIKNLNVVGSGNTQTLFGIFSGSSTIATSSTGNGNNNNTIQNNSVSKTQFGIFSQGLSAASKNSGNVITQNSINTASPDNVKRAGVLVGFENNIQITQNTIGNMASSATGEDTFGISLGTTAISTSTFTGNEVTNATVSKNIINSVRQTGTYSSIGIFVAPATSGTNQISNNMILGVSANGTSGDFTSGIFVGGGAGSTTQIYYNSVALSGTQTGGSDKSYGLAVGGSDPIVDIRNNIFYNTQNNGTGNNYAVGLGYSTFANLTSNYNDFFTATGATYFIAGTGSISAPTNQATLANWQALTLKDVNSFSDDPKFIDATANLHINTAIATKVESAGTPIAGITTDIDGDTRNVATPDIGADEGTFIAPVTNDVQATAFIDPTNGGTKVENIAFSPSASFTNNGTAGQTNVPVRYRICSDGACTSEVYNQTTTIATLNAGSTATATFASATLLAGTYTIKAKAELIGDTVSANDEITGTLIVEAPLSGSYTVGSGGNYPSLTNNGGIFQKINQLGASGPITINITSDLTGETGTNALNEISGSPTVTIKPSGAARTISSTATATRLIALNGVDNVTIDGSLSGGTDQSLTLSNTNTTSTGTTVVSVLSLGVGAGSNNTTIKNTVIQNGTNFNTSSSNITFGIFAGLNTGAANGPDNDNLTIQNNLIQRVSIGIQSFGETTGLNDNTVISDNTFGGTVATDFLGLRAINFGQTTGGSITRNTVRNIANSAATDVQGIIVGTGAVNSGVTRNNISNLDASNTGGYGATGLSVATGAAASNILVANNFISNIRGTSYTTSILGDTNAGIRISGTNTGGINVFNNSVNLYGSYAGYTTSATLTAALMINATTPTGLDIRNNILINSFDNTGRADDKNYAIYTNVANTVFTGINYNDYYISGAAGVLGAINSTDATTLSALATASAGDANSKNVDPQFASNTDLHIPFFTLSQLIGQGATIASVTNDYDSDIRPSTAPDIGADEIVQADGGTIPAGTYYNAEIESINALGGNVTVTNNLVIQGIVDVGANTLTLDCNATMNGSQFNYIVGKLAKKHCGAGTFTYHVGTDPLAPRPNGIIPEYSPVDVTVTAGTFPSTLTINANDATLPNLIAASSVSRNWSITETGDLTVDMTFHYLTQDINGVEANYKVYKNNGVSTTEVTPNSVDTLNHTATVTGVSTFSDWGVGLLAPTAAGSTVTGKLVTPSGRGLANSQVMLTDSTTGEVRYTRSGSFGVFTFTDLPSGHFYILDVPSKKYHFNQTSFTLNGDLDDLVLTANP